MAKLEEELLVANTNQIWRNHALVEGQLYPGEIDSKEARRLVDNGLARWEEREAENDIPEDFPARTHFLKAGITEFANVIELYEDDELQSVDQVGQSTETKIKNYFE